MKYAEHNVYVVGIGYHSLKIDTLHLILLPKC